ncbi:MAG: lysylphosphatidylglycerol synthase domain-containing protein [Dehalococcoidia bacterium]
MIAVTASGAMAKRISKSLLIRLCISGLLLSVIAYRLDGESVFDLMLSAKIGYLLLALFIMIGERVVLGQKLNVLLTAKDGRLPLFTVVKIHWMSTFAGIFLPSLGSDIVL